MIDLHAHLLPGIDDGPADMDGAVEMAAAAVSAGTRILATTPHIDVRHGVQPSTLAPLRAELELALAQRGIDLRLVQGGEVAIDRLPDLDTDALELLTLGSGNWLLLECPFGTATSIQPALEHMQRLGFRVLLAHPERSPQFMSDLDRLLPLIERGARTQITSSALKGAFGPQPRRTAERMLERGLVHVIASDGHSATARRPDVLRGGDALRKRYGSMSRQLRALTEDNPWAILRGEEVPASMPVLERQRMRWGRSHR